MIRRLSEHLLFRPDDLAPLRDDFDVIGVFNPGAVEVDQDLVLLVRVAEKPRPCRSGYTGLPRREVDGQITIDWVPDEEWQTVDQRVVRRRSDGLLRLTSISHLHVFRSLDRASTDWAAGPLMVPDSSLEEYGIEDPRITKIEGRYWITYVAVSRHGAATALASTQDMKSFDRHGLIFCPENKDVVLFPQRFSGHYVAIHRPSPHAQFSSPEIWLGRSPNLLHWGQHEYLLGGTAEWEAGRVGAGAPPVLLREGWLVMYHGSRRVLSGSAVGAYSAGALLLDRDNPAHILRRSHQPIMTPTAAYEQSGFVDNVIFPTAMIARGDILSVYYGAADSRVGVVDFSQEEMLAALH